MSLDSLCIGGVQWNSFNDYPDSVCAVVFFRGCSLRCRYCHNADLQTAQKVPGDQTANEFLEQLKNRAKILDAVTLSGGEPLLQNLDALKELIFEIHQIGLLVKLDTCGNHPQALKKILEADFENRPNYIAMDYKAPISSSQPLPFYQELCGPAGSPQNWQESLSILKSSNINFELRTTWDSLLTWEHFQEMYRFYQKTQLKKTPWFLQKESSAPAHFLETFAGKSHLFQAPNINANRHLVIN